jgi:uncharacterized RDD family membrane protein YckC
MTTDKKKITDIFREQVITRKERNQYGEWETVEKVFQIKRPVDNLPALLRLFHLFIDGLIINGFYFLILNILSPMRLWMFGLLVPFVYYVFMEFYFQATIGKLLTGSVVVNEYGDKPDFKSICLRTIIRIVPFEPFSIFWVDGDRWWHDSWTKTYVISEGELSIINRIRAGEKPKRTDIGKWDEWHSWQQNV